MDHIEMPNAQEWEARRQWFETQFDIEARGGGYVLGEHATGLLVDLQAIFCTGAFVSVLIVGCAIIDAHLREIEADENFRGGMQAAFGQLTSVADLDWLRKRRNSLVHFDPKKTLAISVDHQWSARIEHEAEARRAVELVADVLFEIPFV